MWISLNLVSSFHKHKIASNVKIDSTQDVTIWPILLVPWSEFDFIGNFEGFKWQYEQMQSIKLK